MAAPIQIEVVPQTILNEMVAFYQAELGITLQPAQVERVLLNVWAYRESLLRSQVQAAATNNLLSFSTEPVLDYLVELLGVIRLSATNALVTIEFTVNTTGVTIPSGTRVSSVDGLAVFRTQADIVISSPNLTAQAVCVSVTSGENFNGYAIGTITTILDPQAFLDSATNLDISAGGSSQETDDQLRARARLAPEAFGTAGSVNAYKFWAYTANPAIIDVGVPRIPVTPGTVLVYPLLADGTVTPPPVLDQVLAILDADEVRPLTDTVIVNAPSPSYYTLDIDIVIFEDADPISTQANALAAVEAYVLQQRQRMGRDVMEDQITAAIVNSSPNAVYDVDLGLFTDLVIADFEYAVCQGVTVTVTGTNEG